MSLVPKSRQYFIICEDGWTDKNENFEALSNSGGGQRNFKINIGADIPKSSYKILKIVLLE
jgi:hypothetical protein